MERRGHSWCGYLTSWARFFWNKLNWKLPLCKLPAPCPQWEVMSKSWVSTSPEAYGGKLFLNNALICDCTFIKRTALIEASAAFFFFFEVQCVGLLASTEEELTCRWVQGIFRCVASNFFFFHWVYRWKECYISERIIRKENFFSVDETQPKEGKIFHLALTLIIPYDEKSSSVSAWKRKWKLVILVLH